MTTEIFKMRGIVIACILAMTSVSGIAAAQATNSSSNPETQAPVNAPVDKREASATKHVSDAATVVYRMEADSGMNKLLQQAKGVLIVPTYGRAALGVGGSGGAGVLLVKRDDGTWSDPAFYNIGGISIGVQVGAESGPIALVLNNDKAVSKFMQKNAFSLSADAGLTIVNWAKLAQGSVGTGDVVAWAGTKGAFGNVVTIGVNDIRFNQNETTAYYHQNQTVAASDVVSGKVKNSQANTLKEALAAASTGTGSSGGSPSSGMTGGPTGDRSNKTGTPDSSK